MSNSEVSPKPLKGRKKKALMNEALPPLPESERGNVSPSSHDVDTTQGSELRAAKKTRDAQRNRLQQASNELDDLFSETAPSTSMMLTLSQLLEVISLKLDESDKVIQDTLEGAAFIADDEECFNIQRMIRNQINKVSDYLNSNKSSSSSSPTRNSCCSDKHRKPELFLPPRKKLPLFSGDSLEFAAFLESFESIAEGHDYDDVTKLELLLDCLRGNALKLVSGYSRVGDNYKLIMKQLKNDFGNKAKVIETLILKLIGLSPPKYNYDELYKFKADIFCHVESLKTKQMVGDCSSCSIILGSILAQKIPQEIKDKVPWGKAKENWSLDFLIEMLDQALSFLEASKQISEIKEPKESFKKNNIQQQSPTNKQKSTGIFLFV